MESASKGTYISAKAIQAITKKREKINSKALVKEAKDMNQVINEEMDEDLASDEYDKRNRSFNECDSDELDGALNLSDCEEEAQNFRSLNKKSKAITRKRSARKFVNEIDTNVFKIEFKTLKDNAELATGDPIFCQKCQAVFNIYSTVEEVKADGDEKQVWKCEFCYNENIVDLEEEEKPQNRTVNYIIEAAAQIQDKKAMGNKEISVVFCIDQSGSMCCSQAVKGKFRIKGDKTKDLKELMKFSDGSDQFMDNSEKNVTYVSRMQCLQGAIDQQIIDMANGAADRKLGIVTFNNQVTVIGDGAKDPQIISGDKLYDYDMLIENGLKQGEERMKNTIGQAQKKLSDKLMSLEETGPTALGPAVATSIAMAANGAPGSQVVICTDGLANIGLGAFDEAKSEDEIAKVVEFYEKVGNYAKSKGVTINIVSIIGDECNLDTLSKLAELTGGNVERVDPVQLTSNFANILSEPIIASQVITRVKLHKGLQFRNEADANLSEDKTLLVKDLGNVTESSEITFEYTLKNISDIAKMQDIDLSKMKDFPFQAQITYTALDGSKCIRVLSQKQVISNDRDELEQNADYQLLGQHCIGQSSNMAKLGMNRQAQAYAKGWGRKMKIQANTVAQKQARQDMIGNFGNLYKGIGQQEQLEQACESSDEDEDQEEQIQPKKGGFMAGLFGSVKGAAQSKPVLKNKSKAHMSDKLSSELYQGSKINSKKFNKK